MERRLAKLMDRVEEVIAKKRAGPLEYSPLPSRSTKATPQILPVKDTNPETIH